MFEVGRTVSHHVGEATTKDRIHRQETQRIESHLMRWIEFRDERQIGSVGTLAKCTGEVAHGDIRLDRDIRSGSDDTWTNKSNTLGTILPWSFMHSHRPDT